MMRGRSQEGYALLAALVIMGLAAVFAAASVTAVTARDDIAGADASGARCQAAMKWAIDDVCLRIRSRPLSAAGRPLSACGAAGSWRAEVSSTGLRRSDAWPSLVVRLTAAAGPARANVTATTELRAEAVAQGVNVAGDAELRAATRIEGCGLYCGGCVRGREWLGFGPEGASSPENAPDWVRGQVWPRAGVHALGSIWADGEEIHASEPAALRYAADTDTHRESATAIAVAKAPDDCLVASLREDAVEPGSALVDGELDLSLLPPVQPQAAVREGQQEGYIVVLDPPQDGRLLRVVGERVAGACPVALVVLGDVVIGEPGRFTSMAGAVVAGGALSVNGRASVCGHLFARSLTVNAPLRISVPVDWRERPLAGLTLPVIVALE